MRASPLACSSFSVADSPLHDAVCKQLHEVGFGSTSGSGKPTEVDCCRRHLRGAAMGSADGSYCMWWVERCPCSEECSPGSWAKLKNCRSYDSEEPHWKHSLRPASYPRLMLHYIRNTNTACGKGQRVERGKCVSMSRGRLPQQAPRSPPQEHAPQPNEELCGAQGDTHSNGVTYSPHMWNRDQ